MNEKEFFALWGSRDAFEATVKSDEVKIKDVVNIVIDETNSRHIALVKGKGIVVRDIKKGVRTFLVLDKVLALFNEEPVRAYWIVPVEEVEFEDV